MRHEMLSVSWHACHCAQRPDHVGEPFDGPSHSPMRLDVMTLDVPVHFWQSAQWHADFHRVNILASGVELAGTPRTYGDTGIIRLLG